MHGRAQGHPGHAQRRHAKAQRFQGCYPGIFGISGISTLGISGMPGIPPDAGPCPGAPSTGSPGAPPSHDGSSTLGISIGGRPCKCRCVLHVLSGSCRAWQKRGPVESRRSCPLLGHPPTHKFAHARSRSNNCGPECPLMQAVRHPRLLVLLLGLSATRYACECKRAHA